MCLLREKSEIKPKCLPKKEKNRQESALAKKAPTTGPNNKGGPFIDVGSTIYRRSIKVSPTYNCRT
jgi:hypothetical protein